MAVLPLHMNLFETVRKHLEPHGIRVEMIELEGWPYVAHVLISYGSMGYQESLFRFHQNGDVSFPSTGLRVPGTETEVRNLLQAQEVRLRLQAHLLLSKDP